MISDVGKDFISKCIEVESSKRLSAHLALHHPWIKKDGTEPESDNSARLKKRKRDTEEEIEDETVIKRPKPSVA